MKIRLLLIIALAQFLINTSFFAQAPQKMSYQAVIRNSNDSLLISTPVGMRISLVQGTPTGIVVFSETQIATTNANGLVSLQIGMGTAVSGTFAGINWAAGPYYIKTETDLSGGTNYTITSSNEILSVPYALFSANGTPGPVGPIGLTGETGAQGAIGLTGPAGATGAQGIQGLTGPAGVAGPTGPIGLTGPAGAAGTNGTNGAVGSTGLTGAQGIAGTNGTTGAAGETGPTGAQGIQGATGLLPSGAVAGNTAYWNGSQWIVNNSNIFNSGAGVGIGTVNPNTSAKLDVESTTQGFLPPRMTTVQRDAIASPATGLVIFNTTTNCLNFFIGSGWNETCGTLNTIGTISSLNCVGATTSGTLYNGYTSSGVSRTFPYSGGNGGIYSTQAISSTGVLGLIANLSGGFLALGVGNLVYTISGIPTTSGTASFTITVGGQSCSFTVSVLAVVYPAGTVNCAGATAVVNVTNPTTGKIWMDRNLGATQVATSSTHVASYGDLYQWGRRADGHQCRTSTTTATLSGIDQPANGNFILAPISPYDWRSPQNVNLWQGVNGVNNPCPNGFRIPTETEINAELLSWSSNNSAGAFASPLKLPMAGGRYDGSGALANVGTLGSYWMSTINGTNSGLLFFNNDAGISSMIRAVGHSVRCLKD